LVLFLLVLAGAAGRGYDTPTGVWIKRPLLC